MKLRVCTRSIFKWSLYAMAALALPIVAMAQDDAPKALPALIGAGIFGFIVIISLAVYVYLALALYTIANKTRTENAWFAWIPIIQGILMLNIAKKPIWWIILMLIPVVNIIIGIIVWMGIAEARNKPNWWGILLIVPVVGIIVPGYLAWSD